ncbi:MAG: LysR substrate-binding domain-containing protein [Sandaracinaceae bacterium]
MSSRCPGRRARRARSSRPWERRCTGRSAPPRRTRPGTLSASRGWRPQKGSTRTSETVPVSGRLATNDRALRMAMVRGGMGIGLVLRPYVEDELASGALVAVLPELLGTTATMNVVFAEKEKMQPKVRAFIDHVVRWFAENGVETALHPPPR